MSRLCLYFKPAKPAKRWFEGDQQIRRLIRRWLRGANRISSVEKVFNTLCKGLDQLNMPYHINLPFNELEPQDKVVVLGMGKGCLEGYRQPNKIVAGIGLMSHPNEWPDMPRNYPVAKYLQHSEWTNRIYEKYYGSICKIWFAGIDTEKWKPITTTNKIDVLVYDKIMWERDNTTATLLNPLLQQLKRLGLKYKVIRYGKYREQQYFNLLGQSACMLFLCEHESQGLACQEALAMNVPVMAWNQGLWLDPTRFALNEPLAPASSVPYFDHSCGSTFKDTPDFIRTFASFYEQVKRNSFEPRAYVLQHLTIEKSTLALLKIVNDTYA